MKVFSQCTFLLMILLFLACTQKPKDSVNETKLTAAKVNDLPDMQVRLLNGNTVEIEAIEGKVILVLFQPDCDHCQNEAQQIEANLDAFRQYDLYFISSAPAPDVKAFADQYNLSGRPAVWFGTTSFESVLNNFGSIPAPSMFIYLEGGKLIQELNGEIDISVILKYL